VRKVMVEESVIIVSVIDDLAVDDIPVIFVSVIVFIDDIVVDWLVSVLMGENVMQELVVVVMMDVFVVLSAAVPVEVLMMVSVRKVVCVNMVRGVVMGLRWHTSCWNMDWLSSWSEVVVSVSLDVVYDWGIVIDMWGSVVDSWSIGLEKAFEWSMDVSLTVVRVDMSVVAI
jgi:hypothetical protein